MFYLLLILVLLTVSPSYAAVSTTLQSAVAADGVGTAATAYDVGTVGLNVSITGKASVNFEGSIDGGTTYAAISCIRAGSTSGWSVTTNSSGLFFCAAPGLSHVRTPVVGWTSGTVTVTANMMQMTLNTLLSGEDQTNNLLMTSGGVVRGTEGNLINSAVGDATSAVFSSVGVTGWKTMTARITGAGSVSQVITIYGGTNSSMAAATSDVVCTITLSGTSGAAGTAATCPPWVGPFLYYRVVTSGSAGTPTTILTMTY